MRRNQKLELWASAIVENELGEKTKEYQKIKDVYCEIRPQHGGTNKVADTDITQSYTIQRIFTRKKSIKKPEIDMFFKDSDGLKYIILDFFPHYKSNAEWEFRTRINYE